MIAPNVWLSAARPPAVEWPAANQYATPATMVQFIREATDNDPEDWATFEPSEADTDWWLMGGEVNSPEDVGIEVTR